MERGEKDADAVMLKQVNDGQVEKDSKALHNYLVKKLNEVPHLLWSDLNLLFLSQC